jgi:hypothetical protein
MENYSLINPSNMYNNGNVIHFGHGVSISGDYAIVGARYYDTQQGCAYIFELPVDTIVNYIEHQHELTASDGEAGDSFGSSVSISGDYAIIGAFGKSVVGNQWQGQAYIFVRSDTTWTEQAILAASDGEAGDSFGYSVSISGDYAIIGAYSKDVGGNEHQGQAYIFIRSGTIWTEQAILTASDGEAGNSFGKSVSISGNYAIIGAQSKNIGGNQWQGQAYIFMRSDTTWTEQAIITASDGEAGDHFGKSVSVSGDYAIIGASSKDVGGNNYQGQAYVFMRSDTEWTEQAILSLPDGEDTKYFGATVSISDNYAIVGAKLKAYIFKVGDWTLESRLVNSDGTMFFPDEIHQSDFGTSGTCIYGERAIIGASSTAYVGFMFYGEEVYMMMGSAYIFEHK